MTPEAALSQAEKFQADGKWEEAISTLHDALQNRRNKGNNAMMEKMMVRNPHLTQLSVVDVCRST